MNQGDKTIKPVKNERKQPVFSFRNPLKSNIKTINTMCEGTDGSRFCPIREHCLRHNKKPDPHYQAWFAYLPYKFENQHCECFIPIERAQSNRPISWF